MIKKIAYSLFLLPLLLEVGCTIQQGATPSSEKTNPPVVSSYKTLAEQDKQFRLTVVGGEQVNIEKELINNKNGVFVLFTPTHGTPLMISEKGDIPEGLIPAERLSSYDSTVKPRVETTHQMVSAGVQYVLIRSSEHRDRCDDKTRHVDETHYDAFIKRFPDRILDLVIDDAAFKDIAAKDMPAAFYYYIPEGKTSAEFASIFGKQINSPVGNKLSDPGSYLNRKQDLEIVNGALIQLGLQPVEKIMQIKDISTLKATANTERKATIKM